MRYFIAVLFLFLLSGSVKAEFIVTSAIVEFSKDTPPQQDIEIISRSRDNDYIVAELIEVINPGASNEIRRPVTDAAQSHLLVTPDRTILGGGSRKTIRFVLLKPLDDQEHIYRVAIKPVVKGVENNSQIGLKILLGYEILVILRPQEMKPSYQVVRQGNSLTLTNNGNTNIVLQNGQQCTAANQCSMSPTIRSYAGQSVTETLPYNTAVSYSVWNGQEVVEKQID